MKNPKAASWHLRPAQGRISAGFTFWADRPLDLVKSVHGAVKNVYEVMYVPGGRWRFFGRFNHQLPEVTTCWFQLCEFWMEKYLKPQCVRDLLLLAAPYRRVRVHKTGKLPGSHVKDCVKNVVLAIVPSDDLAVLQLVRSWPDEVNFGHMVGGLHTLSNCSTLYQYNAVKVRNSCLETMFDNYPWGARSQTDIIMRPTDDKGNPLHDL